MVAEQQYANRSGSTEDMYENNMALHNQSVPKASIAFLKELLTMSDEAKRYSTYLRRWQPVCMSDTFATCSQHLDLLVHATESTYMRSWVSKELLEHTKDRLLYCRKAFLQKAFREEFEPGEQSRKADSQHASASSVRPGSFLTCVTATQVQMQSMNGAESTLAKLETIRREALQALESIAA